MFLNKAFAKDTPEEKFIGGIIIPETTSNVVLFRYCRNQITNNHDLAGWVYFNRGKLISN